MILWTELGADLPPDGCHTTAADNSSSDDGIGGVSGWSTAGDSSADVYGATESYASGSSESYLRSGEITSSGSTTNTRLEETFHQMLTSTQSEGNGAAWSNSSSSPEGYYYNAGYSYSFTSFYSESYSFSQKYATATTGTGSTAVFAYATSITSTASSSSVSYSTGASASGFSSYDTGDPESYDRETTVAVSYEHTFGSWEETTTEGSVWSASTFTISQGNSLTSWSTTSASLYAVSTEVPWHNGLAMTEVRSSISVETSYVEGMTLGKETVTRIIADPCSVLYVCGLLDAAPVKSCAAFSSTLQVDAQIAYVGTEEAYDDDTSGITYYGYSVAPDPLATGFPEWGGVVGSVMVPHPSFTTVSRTTTGGGTVSASAGPHQHYASLEVSGPYYGSYSIACPDSISDLPASSSDARTQGTLYYRCGIAQVLTLDSEDTLSMMVPIAATMGRAAHGGYGAADGNNTIRLLRPGVAETTSVDESGVSTSGESTVTDTDEFDSTVGTHALPRGALFAWQSLPALFGGTEELNWPYPASIVESSC